MPKKLNTDSVPLNGVISARYSSHGQREVSIEQQVKECREYAAANNISISAIYADERISGTTDKRPEFQKMIRHAERGMFEVIVAWKSSRIGRNMEDGLYYERRLAGFGVQILYAKEDYGDNAAGRFARRTMMNVNQFQSESASEDIKRGLLHNAMNNMITNGTLPLGYKKDKDGKYALDKPRAALVKEIYKRVDKGETFMDIARDLNSRGLKTSQGNDWNKNSFHRILSNERYLGIYIYGEIRTPGGIPRIIDEELFLRVQDKLGNRGVKKRYRANGEYLLTGKLFCGECGALMVGYGGTSKTGKQHHYYNCKNRLQKKCDKAYIRREWIEREVTVALQNLLMDDNVIHKIADSVVAYCKMYRERSEIGILEEQLRETRKALRNVMNAIEQGIITETTKERMVELEKEQKRIQNLLLLESSDLLSIPKEDILLWFSSLRRGDVDAKEYQAKLIDNVLIAVYAYDDHLKIELNYTNQSRRIKVPFNVVDVIENEAETSVRIKTPALRHKLINHE